MGNLSFLVKNVDKLLAGLTSIRKTVFLVEETHPSHYGNSSESYVSIKKDY
jgi:hypothetical protein